MADHKPDEVDPPRDQSRPAHAERSTVKSKAKKTSRLPEWVTSNLRNKRSLQLWFRCWVVAWASFILMLPDRSLVTLGQAAFFVAMVALMLPPMLTPFLWLLAMSTLVIGALFGWAIGCAAMASALRARNLIVTGAAIQRAQQSAASATNPELAFRSTIFAGQYLDTQSSVVYGAYLLFFTYVIGFITARAQKLKLFCIFATIVLDVHATTGPLFPSANYTLATIFLVPIAYHLAIAAAGIILIFPRSLNADWTDELEQLISKTSDLLKVHQAYLHKAVTGHDLDHDGTTAPRDPNEKLAPLPTFPELSAEFEPRFRDLTSSLTTGIGSLTGSGAFLELEPSRGIFSGKDLRRILSHVKNGGTRIFGMNAFHHLLEDGELQSQGDEQGAMAELPVDDAEDHGDAHVSHEAFHVHASLRLLHWQKHLRRAEVEQHVRFREDLLPVLHRGAMPALASSQAAIQTLQAWLKASNQGRWSLTAKQRQSSRQYQVDKLKSLQQAVTDFQTALDHFIDKERIDLLKPYEGHFLTEDRGDGLHYLNQDSYKSFRSSARPVFLCMLFCANFALFGSAFITNTRAIITLSERRVFGLTDERHAQLVAEHGGQLDYAKVQPVGPKVWFPTGLRKLGKIILSKRGGAGGVGPGSTTVFLSENADEVIDDRIHGVRRRSAEPDAERGTSTRAVGADYRVHAAGDADGQRRAELEEMYESDEEDEDEDSTVNQGTASSSVTEIPAASVPGRTTAAVEATTSRTGASPANPKRARTSRPKRIYAPDPDALPPTNALQRFSRSLSNAYDAACSPDGIFALRYAIVSFALWIPAVTPSSAEFYYRNRGLWALIMGQTGLTITTGEAVFQIAGRLLGSVVGALGGMVVWYISAGSGRGNSIGLGATMGVALVPLTFLRAFVPLMLLLPTMLFSVTLVLIVGYSWIDTHLPGLTNNSGWGKEIAWRRLLLVLIGVAASIVVMLFPRPISTRVQVRKGMASVTRDVHRLYCLLIEAWIISDVPGPTATAGADPIKDTEREHKKRQEQIEAKLALFRARLQIAQVKLAELAPKIKLSAIDLQARGKWDAKSYGRMLRAHARQLEALAQLAGSLYAMNPKWRHQFAVNTAVLNPEIIADVTLQLSLIAASLDKAEPLPHAGIGILFERVLLAGIFNSRIQDALVAAKAAEGVGRSEDEDEEGTLTAGFLAEKLSFETLQKRDYMNIVLGAMALTSFARRTDELADITATLCGELQLRGFDRVRDEQGRRQLQAFGVSGI